MEEKQPRRIGVLDLGTNTFNLVIAELFPDDFKVVYNEKIPVKIGKGGIHKKTILPEAEERAIAALKSHKKTLSKYGLSTCPAFATSAMRDAENGEEIKKRIQNELGITVEIIDGLREAELIFKGVQLALGKTDDTVLIMDIGGGSTEFIIAEGSKIKWMHSYPLGVSRLLEILTPEDPITQEDQQRLHDHLNSELGELSEAMEKYHPKILIGSSGSFDTLVEMIGQQLYSTSYSDMIKYAFNLADFQKIREAIVQSTFEERLKMPGLVPMRAEMMVLSTLFIDYVLKKYELEQMLQSNYALKEGVIAEQI